MLKPLFIDFDYQLLNSASGQIARVFWESQSEDVFQPIIVCAPANFYFKSKWETINIKNSYFIWYLGVVFKKLGLPGLGLMPDMYYYSWAKAVIRNLNYVDFDYIHTLSSPQSTHLIGLELKKRTGKPWVAQFNDPWTDSSGRLNHKPQFSAKIDRKYEDQVVLNADLIIHTNHILADIFVERYGNVVKDKMFVVPLNFNIAELPKVEIEKQSILKNSLKIAHIGEIYSTRSCIDFLKGVQILVNKQPELRDRIQITFVGGIKKEEVGIANNLGIDDLFVNIPRLAPDQLNGYYESSDIFLAIDVNLKRSPSFPSKLMMYYYYKKPILGITNPHSIMEEEMNNSGNSVCYYGQPEQIADFLYRAITDYASLYTFDCNYWKRYTVEHVTSIYKSLVSELFTKYNK